MRKFSRIQNTSRLIKLTLIVALALVNFLSMISRISYANSSLYNEKTSKDIAPEKSDCDEIAENIKIEIPLNCFHLFISIIEEKLNSKKTKERLDAINALSNLSVDGLFLSNLVTLDAGRGKTTRDLELFDLFKTLFPKLFDIFIEDNNTEVRLAAFSVLRTYPELTKTLAKFALTTPEFKDLLVDSSEDIRLHSILYLQSMGRESRVFVPKLIEVLNNDSESLEVREAAVIALGVIGPEASQAFPDLYKSFSAEDGISRDAIAFSLWNIIEEKTVPNMIEVLADPELREQIISYLRGAPERIIGANGVPILIDMLKYTDSYDSALDFFGVVKPSWITSEYANRLLPILIRAIENGNRDAMYALGKLGPYAKSTVPLLIDILENETDKYTLSSAITTLGKIGTEAKTAIPSLIALLEDKRNIDNYWTSEIAETLGNIGSRADIVVPFLINILEKENKTIHYSSTTVIEALGKFGSQAEAAIPLLTQFLEYEINEGNDDYSYYSLLENLVIESSVALVNIGFPVEDVDQKILDILKNSRVIETPWIAIYSLARIKSKRAIPYFIELLQNEQELIRHQILISYALGNIGEESIPYLIPLIMSSNNVVRRNALFALAQVGSDAKIVTSKLENIVNDTYNDFDVRWMASFALSNINNSEQNFFKEYRLINPTENNNCPQIGVRDEYTGTCESRSPPAAGGSPLYLAIKRLFTNNSEKEKKVELQRDKGI